MPRVQVYLPADLYAELKARELGASELLQQALRDEIERLDRLAATERRVTALRQRVGEPTAAERERAEIVTRRLSRRPGRSAL